MPRPPSAALLLPAAALGAFACAAGPIACNPPSSGGDSPGVPSSLIVTNASIWTGDPAQPWAEAMVVENGVLAFVGDAAGVEDFAEVGVARMDLGGRLVLPGLHDVHQHTLEARLPIIRCILDAEEYDPEAYIDVVAGCDVAPGTDWVLGWGHSILTLLEAERDPRLILDEALPDVPVAIMEETSHSTWVNSLALERLGIDADSVDPPGGLILRGADGTPNGLLIDSAGEYPWDAALQPNAQLDALNEQALREGLAANNAVGITSAVDARAYWQRGYVDAYRRVEADEGLSVRMVLSLWASPTADDDEQLQQLAAQFDDEGGFLRVRQIKLYSDGLLENTTAALLAPYTTPETFGAPRGLNYFPPERLDRYLRELQPLGFDVHIHAIGDRAVREALDAVEANPQSGAQPRLTHTEIIDPVDLPRFAALGVAADLQMGPHNMPGRLHDLDEFLGADRVNTGAWRLRDLWDSGATVALSSDYDVGSLSPFDGMERALTRGDQSLPDLEAALQAYTLAAARIMGSQELTGSLEPGKAGDFVVLDQDLFNVAPDRIGETQVLMTVLAGEPVFTRPGFQPG